MASFDFVESASRAYQFIWERRIDVLQISLMAIAVKVLTFVGFIVFGMDDFLRQGLLALPAYFLEGWVIAQVMVMALYRDVAGVMGGESILPSPEDIARNVKASAIVYVLIKLMMSFVVGMTYAEMDMGPDGLPAGSSEEGSVQLLAVAVMMMVFMIWAFRFLWLYVPLVMGRTPLEFLDKFKPLVSSFSFLGTWLLCFVPLILLMIVLSQMLGTVMAGLGVSTESIVFESGLGALHAIIDYLLSLVSSVAIAYGVYSVFNADNKKTKTG